MSTAWPRLRWSEVTAWLTGGSEYRIKERLGADGGYKGGKIAGSIIRWEIMNVNVNNVPGGRSLRFVVGWC